MQTASIASQFPLMRQPWLLGHPIRTVKLWSFPDGALMHTLQDRKKVVSSVQDFPPRALGLLLALTVAERWYGPLDGEDVVGIKASAGNLSSVAFGSQDRILATSGLGEEINIWSLPDGEKITSLTGNKTAVWSLKFFSAGNRLMSMDYEGNIKIWNCQTWKRRAKLVNLDSHGERVCASFHPTVNRLPSLWREKSSFGT